MSLGIRVSKAAKEVGTANAIDLNMATDQNMFKVYSSNIGTINALSVGTVTHNLGYVPNFKVYMQDLLDPSRINLVTSSMITNNARAYAGTANLYIYNTDIFTNRRYFYYLIYDPVV